jgi:ribosomal protein L14
MSVNLGFSEEDFTNIVDDLGVTVSWEQVTKTEDNITGDETLSYATAEDKIVVFIKQSEESKQVKEGILNSGDAIVLADKDFGFAKNDRITYNGFKYLIINDPIRREISGTQMFDTCYLREVGTV